MHSLKSCFLLNQTLNLNTKGDGALDPVVDAEDFLNFSTDTIATEDIPALIGGVINSS